ncbi:phosphatidylserine decarboxylase 1 [Ceratobasidium sp. UAMH 11750]|nr:phosphatidylserine decarboxylase 1 [Ceratobasidium sp. UAMH 11750]
MKLRIPGFRNTRAKVARRAAPVLRFLAAPRRPPLKVIGLGGGSGSANLFPATSYVAKLRAYSTGAGKEEAGAGQEGARRAPLRHRLRDAWKNTPTKWYPLPVGVGAVLLAVIHYRRQHSGMLQMGISDPGLVYTGAGDAVRVTGPWQVHVLAALPLRSLSRLWGTLNTLELPIWMRPAGFRLYAWVFGCNLDELREPDLTKYASLGEFFYRELAEGVRPIANATLVSPADGTVLHFGSITHDGRVEQVKGLTYSLDALLGSNSRSPSPTPAALPTPPHTPKNELVQVPFPHRDPAHAHTSDAEFASVNGIDYSLDQLLGRSEATPRADETAAEDATEEEVRAMHPQEPQDASVQDQKKDTVAVAAELGELFSVSPYIARRIANLFVLNERVALLGRWKHGFFSMIPVGATNVGSIVVNFDKALRTNLRRRPPPGAFVEAHYTQASALLRGQPLTRGQEMGGFKLGSTVVMVFEAPRGFEFTIKPGEKVKVGQRMGDVFA